MKFYGSRFEQANADGLRIDSENIWIESLLAKNTQPLQIAEEWLHENFSLLRLRAESYCVLPLKVANCIAVVPA